MNSEDGKMIINKNGFVDAKQAKGLNKGFYGSDHNRMNLDSGCVREGIEKIFDFDSFYVFVGIKPNPLAVEELPKWAKAIEFRSHYKPGDFKRFNCKDDHDSAKLRFDSSLLKVYLNTIDTFLEKEFGENQHARYMLLNKRAGGYLEQAINWPIIYILKDSSVNFFKSTIENFNCDKSYKIISKEEAPHNYQLPKVDVLRKMNINPFVFDSKSSTISAPLLRDMVNYMIPFNLV